MKVFGYGENPLTFWTLTDEKKVNAILERFDDIRKENCSIYLWPSIGRGTRWDKIKEIFIGEFDAILLNGDNVYCIESKWDGSGEFKASKKTIKIKAGQATRHLIFQCFIERTHHKFINDRLVAIEKRLREDSTSVWATNVNFLLKQFNFGSNKLKVINVLLYFYEGDKLKDESLKIEIEGHKEFEKVLNFRPYIANGFKNFFDFLKK
jgi:hypothetical protein